MGTNKKSLSLSVSGVKNLITVGIFVLIVIVAASLKAEFLSVATFRNLIVQASSVIIIASAVTMVIISGNLDLSVAGTGAMAGVLYAVMTRAGMPVPLGLLLAFICGAGIGVINGFFVGKIKMPSFIVSMATMFIARGIARIGAEGAVITGGLPGNFGDFGEPAAWMDALNIPVTVVYALLFCIAFSIVQTKTVLAKKTYAIGTNINTAELSGIKVPSIIMILYILSGLSAAFAGLLLTSRFGLADCSILPGAETDAIIACVIGGTDINGGEGTVFGTLIGALIVVTLSTVMTMMGLAIYYQNVVKGIVLVLAILMHRFISQQVSKV